MKDAGLPPEDEGLDASLLAAGAELLVLGYLLIERIPAFRSYGGTPGYDLIATNPAKGTSCRIQVKSRRAVDYDPTFFVHRYDFDFAVFVALNQGRVGGGPDAAREVARPPQFYVLPVEVVYAAREVDGPQGRAFLHRIPDWQQYEDAWHLVKGFLGFPL